MPQREIDAANLVDTSWIRQSFMMDPSNISDTDAQFRTLTSASFKFADTAPGGNQAINPPPQFTRYADLPVGGDGSGQAEGSFRASASYGMGRYYSEAIDDNAVHVYMRFGNAAYNSLVNFFTTFYDDEASSMARTGRASNAFFQVGKAIGMVVGIVPRAILLVWNAAQWFMGQQPSKYYYLKPVMPVYWNAVTSILNNIAVNMGIIPPLVGDQSPGKLNDLTGDTDTAGITQAEMNSTLHEMLPDIFSTSGGIDVYALATRYQRLYMSERDGLYNKIASELGGAASTAAEVGGTLPSAIGAFQKLLGLWQTQQVTESSQSIFHTLSDYTQAYFNMVPSASHYTASQTSEEVGTDSGNAPVGNDSGSPSSGDTTNPAVPTPPSATTSGSDSFNESVLGDAGDSSPSSFQAYWGSYGNFLIAEMFGGGAFVSFRVDGSSSTSESFSNTSKESEIQNKINSMSASNRDTRFNFEGGNLTGGWVNQAVSSAIGSVKSLVEGGIQGLTGINISGLSALAGSAFVDIPKQWDTSSADLPRADYTIQLRSPYGNKMSRLLNLYLPLSMLMAGALPLATGRASYTSPFLCEMYCRGRSTIRMGMISSLSITRGVGNMPWNNEGAPLGIDVSFSITDLSSVMYMPLNSNYNTWANIAQALGNTVTNALAGNGADLNGTPGGATGFAQAAIGSLANTTTWDDDNTFTDYMAVLGGLSMVDQVSPWRKWKLRVTRNMAQFQSWKSPAHFASWSGGTIFGRILSGLTPAAQIGQTGA